MLDQLTAQLDELLVPLLGTEFILIDLKVRQIGPTIHIEALADRPDGGITIEECTALNRQLGDLIDAKGIIPGSYMLDISSPGLDRPLKTKADFKRTLGRRIHFFLEEPFQGKVEMDAVTREAGDEALMVESDGQTMDIPYVIINKAKQII